jgi:DNA-3-methyladenine glycosylase
MDILPKSFYERDAADVAREILGKILIRNTNKKILSGTIVETEAYYGLRDPASRAFKGKKSMNRIMWEEAGTIFIYMVHNNWLFNIITGKKDEPAGVLVRALEPLGGIEQMKKNRKKEELRDLTSGPGKLTEALGITKEFNCLRVWVSSSPITILDSKENFEIVASHRIGVSKDLPQPLRFFIRGNKFVSRNL